MSYPIRLGIIDYGAGNLQSVCNAFASLAISPSIITAPTQASELTHLVLPGVGEFGDCVRKLQAQGMDEVVKDWIAQDKPFFGICVGYQILFQSSQESPDQPGLGIFQGHVVKFNAQGIKVPHIGWNSLQLANTHDSCWQGLPPTPYMYFVHSYFPQVADATLVSATCTYGNSFHAAIRRGNLIATQFHPEKSQSTGIKLLQNFLK